MRDGFFFQRFALSDLRFMLREMLLPGKALQWPAGHQIGPLPRPFMFLSHPGRGAEESMEDRGPFAHHVGPQGEDREQKPLPVLLPSDTPVGARLCCTFAWPLSFPSLSPARKPRGRALPHLCAYSFTWRMQNPLWKKKKKSHLVQAAMRQLLQLLLTFTLGK